MRIKITEGPTAYFIEVECPDGMIEPTAVKTEDEVKLYLFGKGAPPELIKTVMGRLQEYRTTTVFL
jgi:hypothetical protein